MNYSIIIYIIGMILKIEAVFMALPAITALIYQETSGVAFLITIALCLVIGLPLTRKKPTRKAFYTKEGFVTVALSWIVLSIIGAIPFVISRSIPNPVDALFETVSGFTTTGASILSDVETLPHCMLMWRSFTHWIGGMGVLVFILSLLPLTGGYHMNLMKAESPGPSVSKLAPKVQSTAKILYSIYFVMTVIQILLLLVGGTGKDIVFETDGKDITFHLTVECNDAEPLEYATDDVMPETQEDASTDESVSADDVQNNGGYIVQSFGYQD